MLDLLLRGARLPGEVENRDIGVKDGMISDLEPESRQTIDLGGALVTPRSWSRTYTWTRC